MAKKKCKISVSNFPVFTGILHDGGNPDEVLFTLVVDGAVRHVLVLEYDGPRYLLKFQIGF